MKFMGAHTVLALTQQVNSEQPFGEWYLAVFKDRANQHRKLLTAISALPDAPVRLLARASGTIAVQRRKEIGVIDRTAMRAYRAIRPPNRFNKFIASFFTDKLFPYRLRVERH